MARFKGDVQSNRGPASRLGSAASGIYGYLRGWGIGVRIFGETHPEDPDRDSFRVSITGGSAGRKASWHVATVCELPAGQRETILYHPLTGRVVARVVD